MDNPDMIFVSWSGNRSKFFADKFYRFLGLVLPCMKRWMSSHDIESGTHWNDEVSKNLKICNTGIICVTNENKDKPWVLFEAGAVSKLYENSRVIPLLFDLKQTEIPSSHPLATFQMQKVEREEVFQLINDLNRRAVVPVEDSSIKSYFESYWDSFYEGIKPEIESRDLGNKNTSSHLSKRSMEEILEDLVSGTRERAARSKLEVDISRLRDENNFLKSKLAESEKVNDNRFDEFRKEFFTLKSKMEDPGTMSFPYDPRRKKQ
jgi:hypothetical protein